VQTWGRRDVSGEMPRVVAQAQVTVQYTAADIVTNAVDIGDRIRCQGVLDGLPRMRSQTEAHTAELNAHRTFSRISRTSPQR